MTSVLAMILADPRVWGYLLERAIHTPYFHLSDYMLRWWLVPYEDPEAGPGCGVLNWRHRPIARLIQKLGYAVRVHLILRPDRGRHPHDHPWDARTFIMSGSYVEDRTVVRPDGTTYVEQYVRAAGDTAALKHGEFHHISWVCSAGTLTLFVSRRYKGTWGFLVDGVKVPWREYEERYGATPELQATADNLVVSTQ